MWEMEDEKLIEAVREFPCLWRVSSRAYKDARAKENAWKEVAKVGTLGKKRLHGWNNHHEKMKFFTFSFKMVVFQGRIAKSGGSSSGRSM